MIVPETEYMNGPWAMPLDVVGTHRLDYNSDSREQSHSDFSLSNDGTDWKNKAPRSFCCAVYSSVSASPTSTC